MDFNNFTQKSKEALNLSQEIAINEKNSTLKVWLNL